MEEKINLELLENLRSACDLMSEGYYQRTGRDISFDVLQLSELSLDKQRDIIREIAELYDGYEGNENYIHIPDMYETSYNAQHYPIIAAYDTETGEIEGITTIKYHDNAEGSIAAYYPKEDAKFYVITGIIVRQREGMENRGLGTNMYEAATLGLQKYAKEHPEEGFEVIIEIDCTNLKSLYANTNAIQNIDDRGLVGRNKNIHSVVDGIYIVRNREGKLVEAPTIVLREDLIPQESTNSDSEKDDETILSFSIENGSTYEDMLKEILKLVKPKNGKIISSTTLDEESGYKITYISNQSEREIKSKDLKIETNGTENVGENREPNGVPHLGPNPNVNYQGEIDER